MNLDTERLVELMDSDTSTWDKTILLKELPYVCPPDFKSEPFFDGYKHHRISFSLSSLINGALCIPDLKTFRSKIQWLNKIAPSSTAQIRVRQRSYTSHFINPDDLINHCYDSRVLQWIVDNWKILPNEFKEWINLKDFYAWPDCIMDTNDSTFIYVPMISTLSIRSIGPIIKWSPVSNIGLYSVMERVNQFTSLTRW